MAQKRPTKLRPISPGKFRIAEFEGADWVGVSDGGTGADNSVQALSNLGGVPLTSKGQPNGVAPLDGGGFVPEVHLPDSFKPSVHVVVNHTARAALVVQEGDESIVTEDNTHWVFNGSAWYRRPGHELLLSDGVTKVPLVRD